MAFAQTSLISHRSTSIYFDMTLLPRTRGLLMPRLIRLNLTDNQFHHMASTSGKGLRSTLETSKRSTASLSNLIRNISSSLDQSATQQLHFASALTFIEATDHRTVSANPASNDTHGCQPSNWPARVLSASTCRCSPDRPRA